LVDYAVDVKRAEDCGGTIVRDDNYAVAPWRDEDVISCRNRILAAI
jgi:hypothetical protein